jgi:hypothetical protein
VKKVLTIIMLCGIISSYAQNIPRYAATTETWNFGGQTWSDAIRVPECNKEDFTKSDTDPQCRSYIGDGNTWYYYNWPYVNANAATMCPSPWRVPAKEDFETLMHHFNHSALTDTWRYGGLAHDSFLYNTTSSANYWTSTEADTDDAYYWGYISGSLHLCGTNKHPGFQVRCVK